MAISMSGSGEGLGWETGRGEGRKVVFARAVIHSDSAQTKKMSFGYSDEATVILNSKPLFTGKSAFLFRDPPGDLT